MRYLILVAVTLLVCGCDNNVSTNVIAECAAACARTGKGMASCSASTCTCVTDHTRVVITDNDGGVR